MIKFSERAKKADNPLIKKFIKWNIPDGDPSPNITEKVVDWDIKHQHKQLHVHVSYP